MISQCIDCNQEKRHYGRGRCNTCYQKWRQRQKGAQPKQKTTEPCSKCGSTDIKIVVVDPRTCRRCYSKAYYAPGGPRDRYKKVRTQ